MISDAVASTLVWAPCASTVLRDVATTLNDPCWIGKAQDLINSQNEALKYVSLAGISAMLALMEDRQPGRMIYQGISLIPTIMTIKAVLDMQNAGKSIQDTSILWDQSYPNTNMTTVVNASDEIISLGPFCVGRFF